MAVTWTAVASVANKRSLNEGGVGGDGTYKGLC